MKIMKFGGTSVGKPQRMHEVARLVTADSQEKIVVLSAVSGTTITYSLNVSVLEEALMGFMGLFQVSEERTSQWKNSRKKK